MLLLCSVNKRFPDSELNLSFILSWTSVQSLQRSFQQDSHDWVTLTDAIFIQQLYIAMEILPWATQPTFSIPERVPASTFLTDGITVIQNYMLLFAFMRKSLLWNIIFANNCKMPQMFSVECVLAAQKQSYGIFTAIANNALYGSKLSFFSNAKNH